MPDETTASPQRHTLTIDSQPQSLADIGDWVMDATQACGLGPDDSFKVQLAVDEACTNVIEHAYDSQGGPMELSCCREGEQVRVTIRDWGRRFDPGAIQAPDLDAPLQDRQIGGLGLHFMHSLMDRVQFTFDDEGNTLVMTKQCPCAINPDGEEQPL
ncbi:MAG: ATP-binding protein [Chloroflexi bacterium]|nr:ATP-binding protein [Chloroflexota bacterium]MBU1749443.1 ATP-binding protein [Chloroflexota bacterium]